MKNLNAYNKYRIVHPFFPEGIGDEHNGFFFMDILGRNFYIGASVSRDGLQHISVSAPGKERIVPTYEEICEIRNKFFEPSEQVIHFFHVDSKDINLNEKCLHLWSSEKLCDISKEWKL
jgi:hypothetical protein